MTSTGGQNKGDANLYITVRVTFSWSPNVCYTLGWLVEAPARAVLPGLSPKVGPRLLLAGVIFSLCAISAPALCWGGYFVLHGVRLLR